MVTDSDGSTTETKPDYITVSTNAQFSTRRTPTGTGPLTVDFRNASSTDVTSWSWDFGDGTTSDETNPTHVYNRGGAYTVSLTVTGLGVDTETKLNYVNVSTGAGISATPASGRAPLSVIFADASTEDVTSWTWDFGNGMPQFIGEDPPYPVEYSAIGTYTVTLTVQGSTGEATKTRTITVVDPWVQQVRKLASAEPDDCWAGLGGRTEPFIDGEGNFTCPETYTDPEEPEVQLPSMPYTPQTYVWSQAVVPAIEGPPDRGEQVWFGTGGNVLCTTQGAFFSEVNPGGFGTNVCEYGESPVLDRFPFVPAQYGDWYPPNVYQYDVETNVLIDRTPYSDPLRNRCMGLRSAGYHNGVVFLAGGMLDGSISMFAFNASTGAYIGSQNFPNYRTIRKWLVVNNVLYTGVGTSYTGRILRWTGSVSSPWSFREVGRVSGVPRELTEYIDGQGRRRIATTAKGVFLSPAIQGAGLSPQQAGSWIQIWSPNQYEPDYVTRTTYVGGGIEFLNGWLYFGTMHIPNNAADLHQTCSIPPYGIPISSDLCFGETMTSNEARAISSGTARATSIWRIKNAESSTSRVTQLLYGEAQLRAFNPLWRDDPNYDSATVTTDQLFPLTANLGGYVPLLGSSGFGNSCNNYAWVMEVAGGRLFVGTMDYCTLFDAAGTRNDPHDPFALSNYGADLWRIDGTVDDVPVAAVRETTNAFKDFNNLGNPDIYHYTPYGFRCLNKSADETKIYAGMASGVNLGAVGDGAGWQLLLLDSTIAP
jgi:PKD repeat protein